MSCERLNVSVDFDCIAGLQTGDRRPAAPDRPARNASGRGDRGTVLRRLLPGATPVTVTAHLRLLGLWRSPAREEPTVSATEAALAAWPELRKLADLRAANWIFFPKLDPDGDLTQINGLRKWPGGRADVIRVRYTTDAAGLRGDRAGGVLWQGEGTLADVVDELLRLPTPGTVGAPALVKGSKSWLWTP